MSLRRAGLALPLLVAAGGPSCRKAPLHDVGAFFQLADATWFEAEETLFVFYEVTAAQGLGDPSVIEVTWVTDDGRVDWTPLEDLEKVHTHAPVDCGVDALCGSASVRVALEPRDVRIRLRYHRDGELALEAPTVFNVVEAGAPHSHRSLVVYGVFDEANERVQWRSRHRFPTLRNEDVSAYGLRRTFVVTDMRFGDAPLATNDNPYGYGVDCPEDFVATGLADVGTDERAVFHPSPLPLGAVEAPVVCALATVTDALGTFTTGAIARKNPEVRPAFPVLRSPVRDATPLEFFLGPCDRTISAEHEAMQRQRLQLERVPTTCIDDWNQPGFVDRLVGVFRDAIEAERPAGRDMVLVVAVHQDDDEVSGLVEQALAQVVPGERHRSSPRVAGAFVFDSTIRGLDEDALSPVTLWCPSDFEGDDASARACAISPEDTSIDLGPLSFGELPILPSRDRYLDFVETYSERQAGEVTALSFRAPEFATTSDHFDLGDFGVVTFLNGEIVTSADPDAFSHCVEEDPFVVVFRPTFDATRQDCLQRGLPVEVCAAPLLTLDWLPEWQTAFGAGTYELGLAWDFPFLLHMEYETVAAGQLTAFGLTVPFGLASPEESYWGTELWNADEIPLEGALTQCDRFCEHPTFDSAGVYHVTDPFRTTYAHNCYLPRYPVPGDSGFPLDP